MNRNLALQIADNLATTLGTDKTRLSLAIAIALAYALPLPNQSVPKAELFYNSKYLNDVNAFVSEFNERYLIETDTVASGIKALWVYRYKMLYFKELSSPSEFIDSPCPVRDYISGYGMPDEEVTKLLAAATIAIPPITQAFIAVATGPNKNI